MKKWLVINLKAPADLSTKEDLLLKLFDKIIFKSRAKIESWHFLWEPKPYPHTLLLRFYGSSGVIDKLEETFENFLDHKGIEYAPDKAYNGEAKVYGVKGWEYIMKALHLGSDYAIDLIRNERVREKSEEFTQPFLCYVDRWIHPFLNQLLTRIVEYDVLFRFSIHRYVISEIGEEKYGQVSKDLGKQTPKFFSLLTKRVDDFLKNRA